MASFAGVSPAVTTFLVRSFTCAFTGYRLNLVEVHFGAMFGRQVAEASPVGFWFFYKLFYTMCLAFLGEVANIGAVPACFLL